MALTFSAREVASSPVSPAKQTNKESKDALDALKKDLVSALQAVKGQQSAADAISDSNFILSDGLLDVNTTLSKQMLPVAFNAEAQRIIQATLREANAELKFSLNPAKIAARPVSPQMEPRPVTSRNDDPLLSKLSRRATELNSISDSLSKQIEVLEGQLKQLNLGVTAWARVNHTYDDEGGECITEIGYSRFRSRWGIALRSCYIEPSHEEHEEMWPFTDGPRQLRIDAVDKIPELLEQLDTEAEKMISALSAKVKKVEELTSKMKPTGSAR